MASGASRIDEPHKKMTIICIFVAFEKAEFFFWVDDVARILKFRLKWEKNETEKNIQLVLVQRTETSPAIQNN